MNKIIFEGTVNGQKYDNVRAYNEAVKEALKQGPVSASSKTYSVKETTGVEDQIFTKAPTPGISIDYDSEGEVVKVNQLYLTALTDALSNDPSLDPITYAEEMNKELEFQMKNKCTPYIKRAYENKDFPYQLEGYLDDIEHITSELSQTEANILEKMETLNQKYNMLEKKQYIVKNMLDYYKGLESGITNYYFQQPQQCECKEQENTCQCTEKTEPKLCQSTQQESEYNTINDDLIKIGKLFAKAIINSINDLKK